MKNWQCPAEFGNLLAKCPDWFLSRCFKTGFAGEMINRSALRITTRTADAFVNQT